MPFTVAAGEVAARVTHGHGPCYNVAHIAMGAMDEMLTPPGGGSLIKLFNSGGTEVAAAPRWRRKLPMHRAISRFSPWATEPTSPAPDRANTTVSSTTVCPGTACRPPNDVIATEIVVSATSVTGARPSPASISLCPAPVSLAHRNQRCPMGGCRRKGHQRPAGFYRA